jgi:cyclophilin family peptidyl-prolyl cis-trans isomerase
MRAFEAPGAAWRVGRPALFSSGVARRVGRPALFSSGVARRAVDGRPAIAEPAPVRLRCGAVPSQKRIQQRRNRTMKELRLQQMQRRRRQRIFFGGVGTALVIIVVVVLVSVLATSSPAKKASKATSTTSRRASSSTTSTTASTLPTPVSVPLAIAPKKVGCPALGGAETYRYTRFSSPPPMCINPAKTYIAKMVTDAGTITIRLLAKENPVTVNNFVFLASYHFYDGTAFHRVCTGFVDQGGDPTGTGTGGPGYSFDGGAPKSASVYTAGALAMANSSGPSSDGSQFFIVVGNGGKSLTPNYSYFGQVIGGMSVVNKINADGSSASANPNCPPKVVHKILSVTVTAS